MGTLDIKKLIQMGNYDRALVLLEDLERKDQLEGLILKSRVLEKKGDLKQSIFVAKQAVNASQNKKMRLQEIQALINLGYAFLSRGKIIELTKIVQEGRHLLTSVDKQASLGTKECRGALLFLEGNLNYLNGDIHHSLESFEKSLVIRQDLENQLEIIDTLTAIGWVHLNTGNLPLALDHFQRSLAMSKELGNKTAIAHTLSRLGLYYFFKSDFENALEYSKKSLALYKELKNLLWISKLNFNLGILCKAQGEFDLAINYFGRALELFDQLDQKQHYIDTLNLLGIVFSAKGELTHALNFHKKSVDLSKASNFEPLVALSLLEIAFIYNRLGEPTLALSNVEQSIRIFEKVGDNVHVIGCLVQKGVAYRLLGNLKDSLSILEEALDLIKKQTEEKNDQWKIINFPVWVSLILYYLILVTHDLNDKNKAEKYLEQLKKIEKKSNSKYVNLRFRFAEAIVLTMSKRGIKKLQAQRIFQEIIEEKVLEHKVTILAMLNLCELYLLEMKISDADEELFQEISHLLERISTIAHQQNMISLIVSSLILQSKLALINNAIEKSNNLLEKAQKIAKEKQLETLHSKIIREQECLHEEVNRWEELTNQNAPIVDRIKHARLTQYIAEVKKIQETFNTSSET